MGKVEKQPAAQRFNFGGINILFPPDMMPPNKYPYALNVRAYQGGAVGPRLPQGSEIDSGGSGPINSLMRLNDNTISPGFGTWVFGWGTNLNVGATQVASGFSGNRLGMASYRPAGSPQPWMYIADTNKAIKVNAAGLPGASYNTGIEEPQAIPIVGDGGAAGGGPTYPVFYQYKWRSSLTRAVSNPSPPMLTGFTPPGGHVPSVIAPIPGSLDSQVDTVDVYRQDLGLINMTYVTSYNIGFPGFIDIFTDQQLAANPLMQFDDYEPYPSIGLPTSATVTIAGSGPWTLTWVAGPQFNLRWLPGTIINTNGYGTFTLYIRPTSATSMQVINNVYGVTGGTQIEIFIPEPILGAQRLPTLWGPTANVGYFFSVGDPLRPGTLYFTKGNNPDSAPQTNQIEVTSPSEPLINGAIVNGLGIVMSTERGWLIYPNFANAVATVVGIQGSPFQLYETIEGYGLYAKEGICTDGGANLYFWSKEGIRVSQGGLGSKSLTDDDLYVLFPHEGQPQRSYVLGTYIINPPDYTNPNSFALRFAEGFLYADYQDVSSGYWTLVYDTLGAQGWTVDAYAAVATIHADTSGQGIGTATGNRDGTIRLLTPAGNEPGAVAILATPSFDAGDIRNPKRFIDIYTEAAVQAGDPVGLDLWLSRYTDHENIQLSQTTLPSTAGVRTGVILHLANGNGVQVTDVALAFTLALVPSPSTLLYDWQPTFTDYPELNTLWQTELLSLDLPGWKHMKEITLVYLSTTPLTLILGFDAQSVPVAPITVPSSAGAKIKLLVLVPVNKFKLISYGITSSAPFRLWKDEIEVAIGDWGSTGNYQIARPFHKPIMAGAAI